MYTHTHTHTPNNYIYIYVYIHTHTPKNTYATTRATHLPKFQRHAGEEEEAAEAEEAEAESSKCAERSPARVSCHVAPLSVCECVCVVGVPPTTLHSPN